MILKRTNINVIETWKALNTAGVEFRCYVTPGRIVTACKEKATISGRQQLHLCPKRGKDSLYAYIRPDNERVQVFGGNWEFELLEDVQQQYMLA